jgi:hypothetical protein
VKGLGRMEPSDLEFAHLKAIALFGPGKDDIYIGANLTIDASKLLVFYYKNDCHYCFYF